MVERNKRFQAKKKLKNILSCLANLNGIVTLREVLDSDFILYEAVKDVNKELVDDENISRTAYNDMKKQQTINKLRGQFG